MEETIELYGVTHVEFDCKRNVMVVSFARMVSMKEMLLPKELSSDRAVRMWNICKEKRWVDDEFQPLVSQKKAAILASVIADELGLCPKWTAFERLWSMPNLANKLSKAQGCSYYCEFIEAVEDSIV